MIFGCMIGMVLFGLLCAGGMKIISYLNPEPPRVPDEIETEDSRISAIHAFGKSYRCIKTTNILKTYHYDAECNVIEVECKHLKFQFDTEYISITDKDKVIVYEGENEPIECYLTNDMKCLISCNPIISERVCEYRKPWKNKALSV